MASRTKAMGCSDPAPCIQAEPADAWARRQYDRGATTFGAQWNHARRVRTNFSQSTFGPLWPWSSAPAPSTIQGSCRLAVDIDSTGNRSALSPPVMGEPRLGSATKPDRRPGDDPNRLEHPQRTSAAPSTSASCGECVKISSARAVDEPR